MDHSKAPWKLDVDNDGNKTILDADGRGVAEVFESDTPEKVWVNASLMTNAPQLLAVAEDYLQVLKTMKELYKEHEMDPTMVDKKIVDTTSIIDAVKLNSI